MKSMVVFLNHELTDAHTAEILKHDDPRYSPSRFDKARTKEMNGLLRKGANKIVIRNDMPKHANILERPILLDIKNCGTDE